MPELPEVTTTVNGINKECRGWTIKDAWTDLATNKPSRKDFYETIKYLPYFKNFCKVVKNKKIIIATRRGKNILIQLSDKNTLKPNKNGSSPIILIHMKMTGHIMVGEYSYKVKSRKLKDKTPAGKWEPSKDEKNLALRDPYNRFIHFVFILQKGKKLKHLVLCDMRKFAKIALLENQKHHDMHLKNHGPEPVNPDISYTNFIKALDNAPANTRPIKTLLMDTRTIAGIGNIYSDEMLFNANIHPKSIWPKIPTKSKKLLHFSMLKILKKGIDFGGDSMSDYRNIHGMRGEFQNKHNAYKKTGSGCNKKLCPGIITRKVINSRSAHFCPIHQIIYT